jgi:hypothetical protein
MIFVPKKKISAPQKKQQKYRGKSKNHQTSPNIAHTKINHYITNFQWHIGASIRYIAIVDSLIERSEKN